MTKPTLQRLAILYPGDGDVRRNATTENNRFAALFAAFAAAGVDAEPAVYHDDFCAEVRDQLLRVDGVLVWVNPLNTECGRVVLDAMLRDVAAAGIFVSAHPDVILTLGTKEVLYQTRDIGWGGDTHCYRSIDALRQALPSRLASGAARVLKQHRGNDGIGVWKVQHDASAAPLHAHTVVRVRHAQRGSVEEKISLAEFFNRCTAYFAAGGRMIDQPYQERLTEGITRCYLVHDQVAGFGHQAINALFPAPLGGAPTDAPTPGPRLYHPPDTPQFQALKQKVEGEWLRAAQKLLAIETTQLPIIWDCDFLLGAKDDAGRDTYVLCEINVISVAPYPASALPYMVEATLARLGERKQ